MKHIVLYALILMLVGVVCSVGVALVYVAAREPIEANKKATIDASMADIFGPEASVEEIAGAKKDADKVWKATGAGAGAQTAIGTSVLGGMITATFLAIFFIPLFYVAVVKLFSRKKGDRPR